MFDKMVFKPSLKKGIFCNRRVLHYCNTVHTMYAILHMANAVVHHQKSRIHSVAFAVGKKVLFHPSFLYFD